jgi:hypothetical protein
VLLYSDSVDQSFVERMPAKAGGVTGREQGFRWLPVTGTEQTALVKAVQLAMRDTISKEVA